MSHQIGMFDAIPTGTQRDISRLGGEGILTPDDIPELKAGTRRVWALMQDGQFHSAQEIMGAAGKGDIPAMEGLRRMRELRAHGFDLDDGADDGDLKIGPALAPDGQDD